jgi:hypothetical protein
VMCATFLQADAFHRRRLGMGADAGRAVQRAASAALSENR